MTDQAPALHLLPLPPGAADDPTGNVYDAARHLLALADEPDALDRIRAVLFAIHDRAEEGGREEIRERIRDAAYQRAALSEERARKAREHLPHDPNRAAGEVRWSASLADQAAALRSVLR